MSSKSPTVRSGNEKRSPPPAESDLYAPNGTRGGNKGQLKGRKMSSGSGSPLGPTNSPPPPPLLSASGPFPIPSFESPVPQGIDPKRLLTKYQCALLNYGLTSAENIRQLPRVDAVALAGQLAGIIEEKIRQEEGLEQHDEMEGSVAALLTMSEGSPSPIQSGAQTPASASRSRTTYPANSHFPDRARGKVLSLGEPQPQPQPLSRVDSGTSSVWSLRIRPVCTTSKKVVHAKDAEGNLIVNDYYFLQDVPVGRGSYGEVYLAAKGSLEGEVRAIKMVRKPPKSKRHHPLYNRGGGGQGIYQEIAIMKRLRHKNLVTLYEVIDDPEDSKMYIVMQYVPHGPLRRIDDNGHCEPLPEEKVQRYMRQVLSGLRYMHRHGIVHRDLKPDNILIGEDDQALLVDFGVSEIMEGLGMGDPESAMAASIELSVGVTNATKGTPSFFPPEICLGDPVATGAPSATIDAWSFGITLYTLLYGTLPFFAQTNTELCKQIIEEPLTFPPTATPTQHSLLSKLLEKDPAKRLTLSDARHHDFFRSEQDPSAALNATIGLLSPADNVLVLTAEEIHQAVTWGEQSRAVSACDDPLVPGLPSEMPFVLDDPAFTLHLSRRGTGTGLTGSGSGPTKVLAGRTGPTGPGAISTTSSLAGTATTTAFDDPKENHRQQQAATPVLEDAESDGTSSCGESSRAMTIELPAALLSPKSKVIVQNFVAQFRLQEHGQGHGQGEANATGAGEHGGEALAQSLPLETAPPVGSKDPVPRMERAGTHYQNRTAQPTHAHHSNDHEQQAETHLFKPTPPPPPPQGGEKEGRRRESKPFCV